MPIVEIRHPSEIVPYVEGIRKAAELAKDSLTAASARLSPLDLLAYLKFSNAGYHPFRSRPLNLVEQVNQTFTALAAFRAVEILFDLRPDSPGFRLHLCTMKGRDIESLRVGDVEAEVFAAITPGHNSKLRRELERLETSSAVSRYVFFDCPEYIVGRQSHLEQSDKIEVWAVSGMDVCGGILRSSGTQDQPEGNQL